ncbi:MAG: hypothetical protein QM820_02150 [Minicystis sp.]
MLAPPVPRAVVRDRIAAIVTSIARRAPAARVIDQDFCQLVGIEDARGIARDLRDRATLVLELPGGPGELPACERALGWSGSPAAVAFVPTEPLVEDFLVGVAALRSRRPAPAGEWPVILAAGAGATSEARAV